MSGLLYIVSTPIGNLEDMTFRAVRVLKEADVIAAEDTRHSRKLLAHYGIHTPMISYWGEREKSRAEEAIRRLRAGQKVALITDAGTPGISDPGTVLIRRAAEEGIRIVPVPGPTALVSAASVSGLADDGFLYCGFLPPKAAQRRKKLEELRLEPYTIVFYEAPHRIEETLADMLSVLGDRQAVVAKELTKLHEEFFRGSITSIIGRLREAKIAGEFAVVVEGRPEAAGHTVADVLDEVRSLMKKGMGRKEAVTKLASEYGLSRKELYDRSLEGS